MHIPLITGFYAGLLGLIMFILAIHVGRTRTRTGVSLLDGGKPELAVAMRQHGNFTEFVPFCLILLAIMEMAATSIYAIHILGIVLVISRLIHPFGISYERMGTWQRRAGTTGTMFVLVVCSIWTIYLYVIRVFLIP
jgi:uncharacterized membrane protein YecN with MAPEG domain